MVPRIVILHIGTHKTGTTSLQDMVAGNPRHFESQGLYYPHTGRVGGGHHNVAWQLNEDDRYHPQAGTLAGLTDELRAENPSAVLLSSEDFEYLYCRPDQLSQLRLALRELGYRVRVVVTLRKQSDYVESLYAQLLRHGLTTDFDTFVSDALTHRGIVYGKWDFRLDYAELIEGFTAVFGGDAVQAIRYDSTDSVGHLLRVCGNMMGRTLSPVSAWGQLNARDESVGSLLSSVQRRSLDAAFGLDVGYTTV